MPAHDSSTSGTATISICFVVYARHAADIEARESAQDSTRTRKKGKPVSFQACLFLIGKPSLVDCIYRMGHAQT